jgi:hypothetical protein
MSPETLAKGIQTFTKMAEQGVKNNEVAAQSAPENVNSKLSQRPVDAINKIFDSLNSVVDDQTSQNLLNFGKSIATSFVSKIANAGVKFTQMTCSSNCEIGFIGKLTENFGCECLKCTNETMKCPQGRKLNTENCGCECDETLSCTLMGNKLNYSTCKCECFISCVQPQILMKDDNGGCRCG